MSLQIRKNTEIATFIQVGKCPICKDDLIDFKTHFEKNHPMIIIHHRIQQLNYLYKNKPLGSFEPNGVNLQHLKIHL